MVEIWFVLVAAMLTVFAVLDGWDIGAGTLHFLVAKTEEERRDVIAAIGPLWSWHEVWLVAAGGTFLLAFPKIMGVAFSGFYLALWMLLWSFVLRGMSIEVRSHIPDALWQAFWDFVFAASNLVLAVLFGAAFGNVIRGVPLDQTGTFSMSLFTDFGVHGLVGILDWYTISVALFTTLLLAAHGATYLRLKTKGVVHQRSEHFARVLWVAALGLFAVVSAETWLVRPEVYGAMAGRPVAWISVAVISVGAWALWSGLRGEDEDRALAGSSAVIAGLLSGAAAAVFPVILRSTISSEYSLTAHDGATSEHGLTLALIWWPLAAALALTYFVAIARKYRGKVGLTDDRRSYS